MYPCNVYYTIGRRVLLCHAYKEGVTCLKTNKNNFFNILRVIYVPFCVCRLVA